MKNFKLIILAILTLAVCLSSSSCTSYEILYDELKSEYSDLEYEYESREDIITELQGDLEYYSDMIEYYELLCQKYGFLTHEQAYDNDYHYIEPGSLIYHTDFYCKKANTSKLQIVDIFLYSALEKCSECEAACNERYVIRLLDPATKLYHHTYEPCAPHFTKDYKTISTPYIATTEEKAKTMKYNPCPVCIEN